MLVEHAMFDGLRWQLALLYLSCGLEISSVRAMGLTVFDTLGAALTLCLYVLRLVRLAYAYGFPRCVLFPFVFPLHHTGKYRIGSLDVYLEVEAGMALDEVSLGSFSGCSDVS
jgi:hypothetical protein